MTAIIEENNRRKAQLARTYDPETGDPCDPGRTPVKHGGATYHVPCEMLPEISPSMSRTEFELLRFRHDFEYWALKCVTITDKLSMEEVPFRLNPPQRRLVALIEEQRRAGLPLRVIMLKARQWGGSTVIQVYFAWIQIIHRRNWNSVICAHVKDASSNIRGMFTRLLEHYPEQYWQEDCKPEFRPFERMTNVRVIPGRGCRVTICSSESQDSVRSQDVAMVHLSEVAFWKDTQRMTPDELMRAAVSGVARKPLSFVAMESTANGVGNYFHREWLRAVAGESDKAPFFVPWHEIAIYSEPVADPKALWDSLDEYERELWSRHGCTLEAIKWYKGKRSEFADHRAMMAEFPTTPEEAFCATGCGVFASADVEAMRKQGCVLKAERGEIQRGRFVASAQGCLEVWSHPQPGADYVASVDIGGRTAKADWSVISVLRRGEVPEVVAQWRGHIDHDLLATRAADLGEYYNSALLVVESNTWETSSEGRGRYILDRLSESYDNLYFREPGKPGFHTNTLTKPAVIANLIAAVREGAYTERADAACNELLEYEQSANGAYAARAGCHDDILMSRAIALWVMAETTETAAPLDITPLLRLAGYTLGR